MDDQFIITGGWDDTAPDDALNTVARYSKSGFTGYLADLNQRRAYHACSSFISERGETVGFVL